MKYPIAAAFVFLMTGTHAMAAPAWNEWNSTGLGMSPGPGGMQGGPSAVLWGPGNEDLSVFVRGPDNALWWDTQKSGKWGGWQSLGGVISSSPSCAYVGKLSIECFARAGTYNALWMTQTDGMGKWTGWKSWGGVVEGAPSAISFGNGDIAVLVRGSDSALWRTSGGNNWVSLGGKISNEPGCGEPVYDNVGGNSDAAQSDSFHAACYAMTKASGMFQWQTYFSNPGGQVDPTTGWLDNPDTMTHNTWTQVGAATAYQASVVYLSANAQYVFVTGMDNTLWRGSWLVQSGWNWEGLGGLPNMGSGPSCVHQGTLTASKWTCFAKSTFGFLMERRYQ